MAKFVLEPNPTFHADVDIPVPGEKPATLKMQFKYRDREEYIAFTEVLKGMSDFEMMQAVACGWDLPQPYDEEHIKFFISKWIAGPSAVMNKYLAENTGARVGNS